MVVVIDWFEREIKKKRILILDTNQYAFVYNRNKRSLFVCRRGLMYV